MAKTGATSTPVTPAQGRRARVGTAPEHSTQVGKKGMAAYLSAGYISAVTGHITALTGFYRNAPQTGASDGAKTASFYVAEDSLPFKGTLRGTLSESLRGVRANISVDSAGAIWLTYNSDSSSVGAARIEGWTSDWDAGDVNAEVVFTVRAGSILKNV